MIKMFVVPVSRKYLTVALSADNLLWSNRIPKTAVIAVDKNCQMKRMTMMNPIFKGIASASDEIIQNKRSVSGVSGQCQAAHSAKEISTPMMMMNMNSVERRKRDFRTTVKKTKRIAKTRIRKVKGGVDILDQETSKLFAQEPVKKTTLKKRYRRKAETVATGITASIVDQHQLQNLNTNDSLQELNQTKMTSP